MTEIMRLRCACAPKRMTKKCIVLDLDNTLWGGVVGEDGVDGLTLSLKGRGAGYVAFQQALRDLYDRGVILAINSRNTPDDALPVIRSHPHMILREPHFAAMRINWQDKADNIRELAQELRIGLDSMVFLDDDPVNRASVRAQVPEVETPELPEDASQYASFLMSLPYFPSSALTDEDKMRGNLYVTERLRMESEKEHATREEFLKSLDIRMTVYQDDESALERLAQMTEKTNQFNINKRPMSTQEIESYMKSDSHSIFYARVTDRFGDSGIVACALVSTGADVWHIESLLMSCRVLLRGIEDAFVSVIVSRARACGVHTVTIGFIPSEKNRPAADFVERVCAPGSFAIDTLTAPEHVTILHG